MPTQLVNENAIPEIRAKIAYNGEVLITYITQTITLEQLCQEIKEICRFSQDQVFTMKWVDEEGDPCTISTQLELDEAIRLYEVNRDSELTIHGKWKRLFCFDCLWFDLCFFVCVCGLKMIILIVRNIFNLLGYDK